MQQTQPGGRVVLVTGAAGGIGRVITAALLADGHAVAAVDRDTDALKRLAAEHDAPETKGRLHTIAEDLGLEFGCLAAVQAARAHFGTIEAVVNNAGIGISSIRPDADARLPGIEEVTAEMWEPFLAIFVRAPTTITRAVVPYMKQGGWGRIVNNTTSYLTMMRVIPYGTVKATFEAISAVWAKELEGSGITVNVLVPGGPTDTALISDASGWPRDKMLRPEIMGPPAAWLLSDASSSFTGKRIVAARWDSALPPSEAAARSSRAIGWPELTADAVWLKGIE
jgi:NAD(P)-dependent dehydrogenase (short-subunit alcohol dehydrogenase family)